MDDSLRAAAAHLRAWLPPAAQRVYRRMMRTDPERWDQHPHFRSGTLLEQLFRGNGITERSLGVPTLEGVWQVILREAVRVEAGPEEDAVGDSDAGDPGSREADGHRQGSAAAPDAPGRGEEGTHDPGGEHGDRGEQEGGAPRPDAHRGGEQEHHESGGEQGGGEHGGGGEAEEQGTSGSPA